MDKTIKIMKTKILLLLIGLCCANVIQSQEVFPTSDAIWNIKTSVGGWEFYYGLSGDTIINEKTYSKLYHLNDTTLNIGPEDSYKGGIRVEGKRVWFRPASFQLYSPDAEVSEEALLYDFSMNVGDTIWHDLFLQGGIFLQKNITASIVENIINEENGIKRYVTALYVVLYHYNSDELVYIGTDTWIEGIGSIAGLFYFLSGAPHAGGTSLYLACFKQGNEVKYQDNLNCNSCFCYSTSGISENKSIPITVWQENDYIKITGNGFIYPCKLKLFDMIGQVRINKIIASDNDPGLITDKLKGIFLYQLLKDNEIIKTGKIMIK
jgi:hypothetical protein